MSTESAQRKGVAEEWTRAAEEPGKNPLGPLQLEHPRVDVPPGYASFQTLILLLATQHPLKDHSLHDSSIPLVLS